jgi:hypothetical protein
MDPTDIGGVPQEIPSNNWWDTVVQTASDIAYTRAATSGTISGSTVNRPPGAGGVNPQAAGTPGGVPAMFRSFSTSLGLPAGVGSLMLLAVVGYVALKLLKKI